MTSGCRRTRHAQPAAQRCAVLLFPDLLQAVCNRQVTSELLARLKTRIPTPPIAWSQIVCTLRNPASQKSARPSGLHATRAMPSSRRTGSSSSSRIASKRVKYSFCSASSDGMNLVCPAHRLGSARSPAQEWRTFHCFTNSCHGAHGLFGSGTCGSARCRS